MDTARNVNNTCPLTSVTNARCVPVSSATTSCPSSTSSTMAKHVNTCAVCVALPFS